jgi:hypothetical protein
MSLSLEGATAKVVPQDVVVVVSAMHPLLRLCDLLPWAKLMALVLEDLKKTTAKGQWWRGRKLHVRVHLAAYLLQKLYDLTDRQTEYGIRDNAAFQLFTGLTIVPGWHAPDHTKLEEFRSRLSPETQRILANEMTKVAVTVGFGDPKEADFDSTAQEANISYPSDGSLMNKLCGLGKKVADYLREKTRGLVDGDFGVDMKAIREKAKAYFFAKKGDIAARREALAEMLRLAKQQMRPVVELCEKLDPRRLKTMPWNIRRAAGQIKDDGWRLLLDVAHFIREQTRKVGKIRSLHAKAVTCIKKGKPGKAHEFGRVFQLGRIGGNFLFVAASTSLRMDDKKSLIPLMAEHARLYGEGTLESAATDKGYWSLANLREMQRRGVKERGLQHPGNIVRGRDMLPSNDVQDRLRDRRAGIEPLIGHAKHGGQLGRSRMKSDPATLAAGYGSVLGLNLRQLIRHQAGKMKKSA